MLRSASVPFIRRLLLTICKLKKKRRNDISRDALYIYNLVKYAVDIETHGRESEIIIAYQPLVV